MHPILFRQHQWLTPRLEKAAGPPRVARTRMLAEEIRVISKAGEWAWLPLARPSSTDYVGNGDPTSDTDDDAGPDAGEVDPGEADPVWAP